MDTTIQSTIPPARREAYQTAAESSPIFAVMMVLFAVLIIGVLYFFNKKFVFLPGIVKHFFQFVIVVGILVTGIFVTAYANGSQDKLFALLPIASSTRASSDTVPPAYNLTATSEATAAVLYWEAEGDMFSKTYLVTWSKNIEGEPQQTRIVYAPTIRLDNLAANTEYKVVVQVMDISSGSQRLSSPIEIVVKTSE